MVDTEMLLFQTCLASNNEWASTCRPHLRGVAAVAAMPLLPTSLAGDDVSPPILGKKGHDSSERRKKRCPHRHRKKEIGLTSLSASGRRNQPCATGTSYSRPGASRAQKWR